MPIIDFHVHPAHYQSMTQSYLDLLRRQWGDGLDQMIRTYYSARAFLGLMDECGVDFAVILARTGAHHDGNRGHKSVTRFSSRKFPPHSLCEHQPLHFNSAPSRNWKDG